MPWESARKYTHEVALLVRAITSLVHASARYRYIPGILVTDLHLASLPLLHDSIAEITVVEAIGSTAETTICLRDADIQIYPYRLNAHPIIPLAAEDGDASGLTKSEDPPAYFVLDLPADSLAGSWE